MSRLCQETPPPADCHRAEGCLEVAVHVHHGQLGGLRNKHQNAWLTMIIVMISDVTIHQMVVHEAALLACCQHADP